MKQLIQHLRSGALTVADVPPPAPRRGGVVIRTAASLVSSGTERTIVDFADRNLIGKAASRPDLVRQVMDKAKRDGVGVTLDAVRSKLDAPMPLGIFGGRSRDRRGRRRDRPADRRPRSGGGAGTRIIPN